MPERQTIGELLEAARAGLQRLDPTAAHQALHAERTLPGGQRVVADIGDAARPEFMREQMDNAGARRVADPTP